MDERQLKVYWKVYTDAWTLIKNHEKVQNAHITDMIKSHSIGVMNRMFCLVVRQELLHKENILQMKEYQIAFTEAWKIFKKYSEPPEDDDEFWEALVQEVKALGQQFNECRLIHNLLVSVTLEEIERIWKEKIKLEVHDDKSY